MGSARQRTGRQLGIPDIVHERTGQTHYGKDEMAGKKRTKKRVHDKTRARAAAIAMLYAGDIAACDPVSLIEAGHYPDDLDLPVYAEALVRGVAARRKELDERISAASENWSLARMPVADRAILRLAAYEMIHEDAVPVSVSINEAVELAKSYGGQDDSPRFVNGILGRIARSLEQSSDRARVDGPLDAASSDAAPDHEWR